MVMLCLDKGDQIPKKEEVFSHFARSLLHIDVKHTQPTQ